MPPLAFGPTVPLQDGGSDFNAGVTYTPHGVVAMGRAFDGAGCDGCFVVSSPRGQETLLNASTDAGVPWRRGNAAGFTVQGWYSASESYLRTPMATTWTLGATPPGPVFSDGPVLRALRVSGSDLQVVTYDGGWPLTDTIGTFPAGLSQLRSSAISTPGKQLLAQVIDDTGKVDVWRKPSPDAGWVNLAAVNSFALGQTGGRIASTNLGLVMFITDGTTSSLHYLPGSLTTWLPISFSSKPLDLVGRGSRAYLVSASPTAQLEVWEVNPATGTLTSIPVSSTGAVTSAELAVGDFGELAVAWSSHDAGMHQLSVSEIK